MKFRGTRCFAQNTHTLSANLLAKRTEMKNPTTQTYETFTFCSRCYLICSERKAQQKKTYSNCLFLRHRHKRRNVEQKKIKNINKLLTVLFGLWSPISVSIVKYGY